MKDKKGSNDGVSPVVGVMLMLVVTIIIAALVSSFAAGMADMQTATPQLALKGTYSQTTGLTISHAGGEPVALANVEFMTTPSELFGVDASKFAYIIDKSIINTTGNEQILDSTSGFYKVSSFVGGDTLKVDHENCIDFIPLGGKDTLPKPGVNQEAQLKWGGNANKNEYFGSYAFGNPANIGKYFYLDLVDPAGNVITRTKVTITA